MSSSFSRDRLYILTAILRLLFQSTALLTNAWAPFPRSRWNYMPLNNFTNNFCYSSYSFWSPSILGLIVSFWICMPLRLLYFFLSNIPDCFEVYFLPSIRNLSFYSKDFLLFFFCSFFNTLPFTHKSFFIWIFFVTTDEDFACYLLRKSWLLGRAVNAIFVWVWGG
jgi:hypothetical protein